MQTKKTMKGRHEKQWQEEKEKTKGDFKLSLKPKDKNGTVLISK